MRLGCGRVLAPPLPFSKLHEHVGEGVGLGEHGDGGLGEDLGACEVDHFRGDVGIGNAGFGVLEVFSLYVDVGHGVFQPVLHGPRWERI